VKGCPACGRMYPDDAGFCPVDGNQLTSATLAPAASDQVDARLGRLICDRYEVRRVIADGGMGRVYEALDTVGRKNTALKILHPDVVADPIALERFRREFEVSAQLPHEHIVDVLDFQPTDDGSYVLAMEFLYGEELRSTLKREQVLPPERVIRMLSQLALALDEAHARKLVHRDLKPDNVFLCQTREGDIVKILDFGSVKDKAETAKKLTVIGTTIGSPYYMAPEQAQGLETLDQRADVWALAAICYECVTGKVPFGGNNGPAILVAILTQEPSPPSVAGSGQKYPVSPVLDGVMAGAFKKNPAARIPSAGALADAVGQAYGLEGSHGEWARTAEFVLGTQIARSASRAVRMTAGTPASADRGAGAAGPVELGDPFASPPVAALHVAPTPSQPMSDSSYEQVLLPRRPHGLLVAAVVAAVLLSVGVAVLLLLL
jgi:serine/threonine protein kinase